MRHPPLNDSNSTAAAALFTVNAIWDAAETETHARANRPSPNKTTPLAIVYVLRPCFRPQLNPCNKLPSFKLVHDLSQRVTACDYKDDAATKKRGKHLMYLA